MDNINEIPLTRAYSPVAKKWVYGHMRLIGNQQLIVATDEAGCVSTYVVFMETNTMFTGAVDKNGRQIFVGDILYIDHMEETKYVYVTVAGESTLVDNNYKRTGQDFKDANKIVVDLEKMSSMVEVIGNVLEPLVENLQERYDDNDIGVLEIGYISEDDDDETYEADDPVEVYMEQVEDNEVMQAGAHHSLQPGFRGLYMAENRWITGQASVTKVDDEYKAYIIDEETNVHYSVMIESLSKVSKMTTEDGTRIFSGDIISIADEQVYVLRYMGEVQKFFILPYNMLDTDLETIPQFWLELKEDEVLKRNLHPELIGNIFTGIPEETKKRIAGKYMHIAPLTKRQIRDLREVYNPVRKLCRVINSVIYNVRTDVSVKYYTYANSVHSPGCTLKIEISIPNGYSIVAYYNNEDESNSIFYGKFNPSDDFFDSHVIVTHGNETDQFLNILMLALTTDVPPEKIIKDAPIHLANRSIHQFPMKKKYTYDNIIDTVFAGNVSQDKWMRCIPKIWPASSYRALKTRVLDTAGIWTFGESIECKDDTLKIRTKHDLRTTSSKKDKPINLPYLMETGCDCTYLIDADGMYMFSTDIVRYEGRGDLVLFVTSDNDPNDIHSACANAEDKLHIFWTYLSEILNLYETKNISMARWRYLDLNEWINNRDKIHVIGNLIDCGIDEEGSADFTDADFIRDDDPMSLIIDSNDLVYMKDGTDITVFNDDSNEPFLVEMAEYIYMKVFRKPYYDDKKSMTFEEFDEYLDDEYPEYINDKHGLYTDTIDDIDEEDIEEFSEGLQDVFVDALRVSDGQEPLFMADIIVSANLTFRIYFNKKRTFASIFKIQPSKNMTAGICEYSALDFDKALNRLSKVVNNESSIWNDIYEAVSNPTLPAIHMEYMANLTKAVASKKKSYTQSSYMTEMKMILGDIADNIKWRAVSNTGMWYTGNMGHKFNRLVTKVLLEPIPYVERSAGFNTFLLDSKNQFIYENDIIRFEEVDETRLIVVMGRSHVVNFGKIDTDTAPENDKLMRCVYDAFVDGCERNDMSGIQWVPCDYDWFIRNSHRLTVIGNTLDCDPVMLDGSDLIH